MNGIFVNPYEKNIDIEEIRRAGQIGDSAKLEKASKSFEAVMLSTMLEEMRKTIPKMDLDESNPGMDLYQAMLYQMIAEKWAGSSDLGIADLVEKQNGKSNDEAKLSVASLTSETGGSPNIERLKDLSERYHKSNPGAASATSLASNGVYQAPAKEEELKDLPERVDKRFMTNKEYMHSVFVDLTAGIWVNKLPEPPEFHNAPSDLAEQMDSISAENPMTAAGDFEFNGFDEYEKYSKVPGIFSKDEEKFSLKSLFKGQDKDNEIFGEAQKYSKVPGIWSDK